MEVTKSFVQWLSQQRSETNGTSLITVYIPSGYSLSLITKKLVLEQSTGTNIKDKNVGKAVLSALRSSLQTLKSYGKHNAPENGLVLCAGMVNTNHGSYI